MSKGERTCVFWAGLIIVASASIVLFSALWSSVFIYPLLSNPRFVLDAALNTGMQPRSVLDGHSWSFFQAYPWLSHNGSGYSQSDYYWELLVPSIAGASTFILIGLYMIKSGTTKKEERKGLGAEPVT